jgi:hypothetical protein
MKWVTLALLLSGCGELSKNATEPHVSIASPPDGFTVAVGTPVAFEAVYSSSAATAEALVLAWSSDLDGPLPGGSAADGVASMTAEDLSLGTHVITVSASDDTFTSTDDVRVVVEENNAPTLSLVGPPDGVLVSDLSILDVSAVVADHQESDLTLIALAWFVDGVAVDGPGAPAADGVAPGELGPLTAGSHAVRVTATDTLGATGEAELAVEIVPSDLDQDGYADAAWGGEDCDDEDPEVNPSAVELCNGVDDDCDGASTLEEIDHDGDGYAECEGDCDDTRVAVSPAGVETCNGLDDDCSGVIDDGADGDGDGVAVCDCNDANPLEGDLPEVCDGFDNDCDGLVDALDPDASLLEGWIDADADGWGTETWGIGCLIAADPGDCDDADPTRFPGAPVVCNDGVDQDCDGVPDCRYALSVDVDRARDPADPDYFGDDLSTFGGTPGAPDAGATTVVNAGDLDGDGAAELAIGVALHDGSAANAGALYVLSSAAADGLIADLSSAPLWGLGSGDKLGTGLAAVQMDGDAQAELFASAPGAGPGGEVYLIDLPFAAPLDAAPFAVAEASGGAFAAIQALDLDGDGVRESVAVGAPDWGSSPSDSGQVYVLSGPPSGGDILADATASVVERFVANAHLPACMSAGDLDGDGGDELILGVPDHDTGVNHTGAVFVVGSDVLRAGADVTASTADYRILGVLGGDAVGSAVAALGDVDGDGRDDLAVGVGGAEQIVVYTELPYRDDITFDDPTMWHVVLQGDGDGMGTAVAGVGDVDNDGMADMLVGLPDADVDLGAGPVNAAGLAVVLYDVDLYAGATLTTADLSAVPSLRLSGTEGSDHLGEAVFALGDLNGDGVPDYAVNRPDGPTSAGELLVLLGAGM